jgi:Icc protein
MTILAHLSDLHLIEPDHQLRRGLARHRLAYLSTGVPLDADARRRRAQHELMRAERAGADHFILTGDLTEDGVDEQFEVLAQVLDDSGIEPGRITLVPGNHDDYADDSAWQRALLGPLSAYQATSNPDACTVLDAAVIKPISTVLPGQSFLRSAGTLRAHDVRAVERLASDAVSRNRTLVVAQHHPPQRRGVGVVDWIDGLVGSESLHATLVQRGAVHVVHGHVHRRVTRSLHGREHAQIFATESVRDSEHSTRLYRA